MGGCYDISVAGSGVCREARDGACVRYKEEHTVNGGRHGTLVGVRAASQCTQQANINNCAENMCEMVGTTEVCTQCKTGGSVPIDGVCTAKDSATDKCKKADGSPVDTNDKVCGQCGAGYFLHKGGCYKKGQRPGQTICKDTADIKGKCQAGYFKNPASTSDATKQSCITCSDTTGADSNLGVASCVECTAPTTPGTNSQQQKATCTKCASPKYLKADGTCGEASDCTGTTFPKADNNAGNKCVSCGDQTDGITDCSECSKTGDTLKCSACNNNKKPSTAGTACVACNIANCASCDKENVCEACTDKKLSPLKDTCLTDCPAGTYDNTNVCAPCHTSCAECNSNDNQDSCTACYPGHVLNKTDSGNTGTCIPECTGRYAENCEAGMCTANIGGSKYCSKCKSGYVPVDGVCVPAETARAAPAGCTPDKTNGVCTACTGKYFLESGGCYLSTAYPGNTLCSQTASGKCTQCANGQTADGSTGSCPACDPTCKTCTATNDPTKCSACFPGYYLDANKACKKCSETSGTITGVENCISCEKPSSGNGAVTCYVKTDKGLNLSIGAIAGISIAVIVVIGGLVGLLCWWFVCHGKA